MAPPELQFISAQPKKSHEESRNPEGT